jgi:hypothetical protein
MTSGRRIPTTTGNPQRRASFSPGYAFLSIAGIRTGGNISTMARPPVGALLQTRQVAVYFCHDECNRPTQWPKSLNDSLMCRIGKYFHHHASCRPVCCKRRQVALHFCHVEHDRRPQWPRCRNDSLLRDQRRKRLLSGHCTIDP